MWHVITHYSCSYRSQHSIISRYTPVRNLNQCRDLVKQKKLKCLLLYTNMASMALGDFSVTVIREGKLRYRRREHQMAFFQIARNPLRYVISHTSTQKP